jgi:hypothetical protein
MSTETILPGRRTRQIGIAFLASAAILAFLIPTSVWCAMGYSGSRGQCGAASGNLVLSVAADWSGSNWMSGSGWVFTRVSSPSLDWRRLEGGRFPGVGTPPIGPAYVFIAPLWPLALTTAVIGWWCWRRGTAQLFAATPHLCRRCGYSNAGLPDTKVCPECGRPRPAADGLL